MNISWIFFHFFLLISLLFFFSSKQIFQTREVRMKCVTFRCACCKRVLPRNPRVKQQRYCGSAACQRARKAKWQREKMSEDRDYQATQRESQRLWQQNNPDYWRQYRRNNCDYRRRNRLLQRARDDVSRCRQPSTGNSLAKMDTLNRILDDTTMTYIISAGPGNLAKMDALQVKIIPFTAG